MTEAFKILEEAIIKVKWRLICQSSVITRNFHTQLEKKTPCLTLIVLKMKLTNISLRNFYKIKQSPTVLNKTNLGLKMCFSFGVNAVFTTKLVVIYCVIKYLLNIYLIFIQVDSSTSATQNPNPQDRKIHAVRIWIKIADSDTNNLPWGKEEAGLKY